MKRRSLLNAAIAITVIVLGVTLINVTIKAFCYLLLAMFKYPEWSIVTLAAIAVTIQIAHAIYHKVIKK